MTTHTAQRKKKHATTNIETEYFVTANITESGSGFVGLFSIPGKDQQTARNDDGSIAVFDTEDEAIAAAGEDLCEALNARTRSTSNDYGYKVMGGSELAVRLKNLALSPATFAVYCGVPQEKVMKWIDGEIPIPRTVNLIAVLLGLPDAIQHAQAFTDSIIFDKRLVKANAAR